MVTSPDNIKTAFTKETCSVGDTITLPEGTKCWEVAFDMDFSGYAVKSGRSRALVLDCDTSVEVTAFCGNSPVFSIDGVSYTIY